MGWWVLTYLDNDRDLYSLHVLSKTNHPAHLMMAWSTIKPARSPIYRIVRGARIFCGWKYIWDTPNLTEQSQPLDTFTHTFGPIDLQPTDHVWYLLSSTRTLYERYCQSALIHVPPPELHAWTHRAYVGTKLKGIFYTENFAGPDQDQPTWLPVNAGLDSLKVWQLEPDPLGLAFRIYALTGDPGNRTLYYRLPAFDPVWTPLLTNADALALTGSASGELSWVTVNRTAIQQVYVLFTSDIGGNGTWCLRSLDSGLTWTAFQIFAAPFTNYSGNISVGLAQGTSPHPRGSVLYAVFCYGLFWKHLLYCSTDWGQTWALKSDISFQLTRFRCLTDPTDQSIVYTGALVNLAHPAELFRSILHGANLVEVDGVHHLGIYPGLTPRNMLINTTDQTWAFIIRNQHVWETLDYCLNWTDHGLIQRPADRLAILWPSPSSLYFAKASSGTGPPSTWACHVLFISDNFGFHMHPKAGANACAIDGAGDSIPYNCGGVCLQGMQLFPPW